MRNFITPTSPDAISNQLDCETGAMEYTDEQEAVRNSARALERERDGTLKVIAGAGTGKTTTLRAVAEVMQGRGLYLAFNRTIAEDARRKLAATRCNAATMHSVAYRTARERELFDKPESLNMKEFLGSGILQRNMTPALRKTGNYRVGALVVRALANFCASSDTEFHKRHAENAIIAMRGDPNQMHDSQRAREVENMIDMLGQSITEMASSWYYDLVANKRMSHDIYLKTLDLNPDMIRSAFRGMKYLMIDEAQDINPVQRSILEKANLPLIVVGDPYQQIYSWRGAENALSYFNGKTEYLSHSFRFGENIAGNARSVLVQHPLGMPDKPLRGVGPGNEKDNERARTAVICRTNIGALSEAIELHDSNIVIHVDNIENIAQDLAVAEKLKRGQSASRMNGALRGYSYWEELEAEAEAGNTEIGKLVNIIERNKSWIVWRLLNEQVSAERADVIISTAHRAKGLEFSHVVLGGDWATIPEMQEKYEKSLLISNMAETGAIEEYNALYVAVTRAQHRISGIAELLCNDNDGKISQRRAEAR